MEESNHMEFSSKEQRAKEKRDELIDLFNSQNIEDWEISGNINEGGQAKVIGVKRKSDNKLGVFRVMNSQKETDIKRFKREVSILSQDTNRHTNILNILESTQNETCFWYISELGKPFESFWDRKRKENEDSADELLIEALKVISSLCDGLEKLHEEKVVHRDIKPKNIVVNHNGPVLIDFGLVFDPEDERFTDVDSAVGNVRFSHDQMMYRMDEVPTWLDVFQMSQLLIWMVMKKPSKDMNRPLDWRFVIFPDDLTNEKALSLRALIATCSDPFNGPKSSSDLKNLIQRLFSSNELDMAKNELPFRQILDSISKGRSQSIIGLSEDISAFNSHFLTFYKSVIEPIKYIFSSFTKNENEFQIILHDGSDVMEWSQEIVKSDQLKMHPNFYPFKLLCINLNTNKSFMADTVLHFWSPSRIKNIDPNTDPLPNDFFNFSFEMGFGGDRVPNNTFLNHRFFIGMKNDGTIWRSQYMADFKSNKKQTNLEEIENELKELVFNTLIWQSLSL